jgi:hypothetical protein
MSGQCAFVCCPACGDGMAQGPTACVELAGFLLVVLVVLSSVAGPLLTERYGRALVTEARDGA